MTKHLPSAQDVLKRIRDNEIEFVDLKFVDLYGSLQHLTFAADCIDEGAFQHGVNFDGSSVRGFQAIAESDLLLKADPSSATADPFHDAPTLSLFCDIVDPKGYKPYSRDTRGVAKRAERLLRAEGIADKAFFGLEVEFYLFDSVRFDTSTQHGFYFVDSDEAFWTSSDSGRRSSGRRTGRKSGYFAAPPSDTDVNLRSKISQVLRAFGIRPELHHHEVGGAGQNEIGFRFDTLLRAADNAINFKYAVKNTAARFGKTATFMPKPLFEEAGSGMHTNVSLWKGEKNAFYQTGRYADLSENAEYFIGGLLKHARAVCAFSAPSTNSYRRLVPGYEAPINLVHSQRNRSACVRIPFTGAKAAAKRIEFRTPDPTANPYLSCAAVLMAGIDGIRNRIAPPDPVDQDIYEFAQTEHGKLLQSTPGSLAEALDALEDDHGFLLEGGVFTEDLVDAWLRTKRRNEIEYVSLRPHPSEFTLYFDA
jgi:glutamine synthetase